ncbi:MAG: tyrosine-type recombinase/integrase, partial [Clostridia bacterium]|nr:tyrosine-type recombinase/integrase [Clostridia bacterium]
RDETGKPYSKTYLKTIHNQLSAIFNHAIRYYDLKSNPAAKAGHIGEKEAGERDFWTKEEIKEYLGMLYGIKSTDRMFPISKSFLHHEMDRGSAAAGVKRIKIHGLRHSHISHLIDLGFSAVAIADRVGHESIDITYRYAHLFPSKQVDMANKLENERIDLIG